MLDISKNHKNTLENGNCLTVKKSMENMKRDVAQHWANG